MMRSKKTLVKLSAILVAFSATPKLVSEALINQPVFAQAPTVSPTSFPLPESLPSGSQVEVDGSSSMAIINQELKKRFESRFADTTVELAATGTDNALQALQNGEIKLAAIGRPLTDDEKAQGLVEVPISREKIAIIVSPDNPFQGDIAYEQFARIFQGEITDWSELGGPAGAIRVVDRPEFSDTRRSLSQYDVFNQTPFQTGANATQIAEDDTAAVIQQLGVDGIGYAIADQVLNQPNVRVIPMHGTLPDDPRYPYSQPRGYVYKGELDSITQAFLGFATSPAGQEAVQVAKTAEAAAVSQATSSQATSSQTTSSQATPAAPESPASTALVPAETADVTADRGGFPWWLALLAIPILGGLLWWLFREKEPVAAGAAPVATTPIVPPVAVADRILDDRIILTPRDCRNAYAYWEVPEERKSTLRQQGGRKLALRLYDVTEIDLDQQTPHSMKQFDCKESETDLHVPIPIDNRDYLVELGYLTDDGHWLKIARSSYVRVPVCQPVTTNTADLTSTRLQTTVSPTTPVTPSASVAPPMDSTQIGVAAAGAAALAGAGIAATRLLNDHSTPAEPSRIILTPRNLKDAYVYWEASEADRVKLRQQGGEQFQVRLYDVTGNIDLETQPALSTQQYNCDEHDQDRHITIPMYDRDYVAEIGYVQADGSWMKLARSEAIRVAAPATVAPPVVPTVEPPKIDSIKVDAPKITTALTGSAALVAGAATAIPDRTGVSPVTSGSTTHSSVALPSEPAEPEIPSSRCSIKTLRVSSRENCILLDADRMRRLQEEISVAKTLEPGSYIIRLKEGAFSYAGDSAFKGEPLLMLWIHGGRVINQKTNVPVVATWSTLNGYHETLALDVLETATLHAFFFDTYLDDNAGEVTLSITRLPSISG